MKSAEPQQEHHWLHKLVGDWTYEYEAAPGPDQPPKTFTGRDRVRSLGGLWVICEGESECDGETWFSVMTIGFDPAKGRFVGSFIASMMTHQWIYEGRLDPDGRTLRLDAEGPSMSGDGNISKYQDAIEFVSDDHRILHARVQGDDGEWTEFMTAHYRRT